MTATRDDIRIAVIDAFMRQFPESDSSEITLSQVSENGLHNGISFRVVQVDWLDPFRGSIAPRTFDVVKTKTGYTFKEC